MTLSDRAAAYVRTLWPLLLGHLTTWALLQVETLGIPAHDALVVELVAVLATAAVYTAGRGLESVGGDRWYARLARGAGRFLLSLGLDTGQPVYGMPPAETQTRTTLGADGELVEMHSVTRWPRRGES